MKATEIAALTARIIPLLPASAKLPAEARATYGRYKVIPTALLCKAPWNYKVDDLQKASVQVLHVYLLPQYLQVSTKDHSQE